jgi:hypothetical protein
MRRGKRLEPGFATYTEAKEKGWTPHPTIHKSFGVDKHGREIGTGWERDPNVEERHDEYGAFSRAREWSGNGKPSVLFTSNDREAFAKKDPSNFAVLHLRPRPGAQGFPGGDKHEWRTATGDAVEIHGEPIRRQAAATKPCPCCNGLGEHSTGFECYHCDAGRTVPADTPDNITCDGRLPDGGHGKTAGAERPEWADGDFTSKSGHTYHTVTEPKAVTMRTPEGSMAGYVNWGDDGVIGNMNIRDEHQRRGIATELLRRAREQRPDLQHSDRLSDDAQAWLKGIGERTAQVASVDTPVPDNDQPYRHEHDWLPRDHFFAPGEKGLDPRLFDEQRRMHPIVRQHLLSLLNSFWTPKYGDSWQSWARVYLAGSEASHWYGNNDLDILIGVDHEALNYHVDHFTGEPDDAVDAKLTDELREGLNDDARMLPGPDGKETGPWESTFYVNPGAYDIRALKPYAAYDITRDEWAVEPVEVPDDFGPEKLPESTWDVFDALTKLIKAIAELPEDVREREGAALYDYLHADRHSAFGPEGSGLYDPANVIFKSLDAAPGSPLQQLIDWKHAHDGTAATDLETAA